MWPCQVPGRPEKASGVTSSTDHCLIWKWQRDLWSFQTAVAQGILCGSTAGVQKTGVYKMPELPGGPSERAALPCFQSQLFPGSELAHLFFPSFTGRLVPEDKLLVRKLEEVWSHVFRASGNSPKLPNSIKVNSPSRYIKEMQSPSGLYQCKIATLSPSLISKGFIFGWFC